MITHLLKIGVTLKVNENNSYGTRSHKINVYFFRFDAIHKIHSLYAILSNVSFLKGGDPIVKKKTYARKWNMQRIRLH